jgi:hypothetical protein
VALTVRVGSNSFDVVSEVLSEDVACAAASVADLLDPQPNNDIDRDCCVKHDVAELELRAVLREESELREVLIENCDH